MNIGFYIVIIILFLVCILLIMKIYTMKKSIKEIERELNDILKSDTNHLITISSSDKSIKNLANSLNSELKELRNQKLQYENGNQELKTLITNISHDMRTPLTAISGYIDFMKESEEEKTQEYIEIIERKTNDLIALTNQLFDFSKTMDIGVKLEKQKYCINEILEETLANYYSIFKANKIEPQIDICKEKIYRSFDKNTIIRVFENILSNISKYSNGDFHVILAKDGKITFSNEATSLDATTVQKIFDRYFTVENAKKSTGLGLSIAKQLVELNNGNISAKYIDGNLMIEIEFEQKE